MKDSIHMMKEAAGTCPGVEDYLDVYYLQSVVSKRKGQRTLYYMTLLAYSAIHNQKGMMEMLIDEGASMLHMCLINLTNCLYYCLIRPSFGQQYDRVPIESSVGIFPTP